MHLNKEVLIRYLELGFYIHKLIVMINTLFYKLIVFEVLSRNEGELINRK